jgi:alkylated DNA repair dioxygenase AlkB
MHRSIGFFSNESKGYKYSGQIAVSQPLTPELSYLIKLVGDQLGTKFNAVLVTIYHDASDYISAHYDDESALAVGGVVAAISFGATRTFRIRDRTKKIVLDVKTQNGQLLAMTGKFQDEFTHEIPKGKCDGPRISYTFRYHTS